MQQEIFHASLIDYLWQNIIQYTGEAGVPLEISVIHCKRLPFPFSFPTHSSASASAGAAAGSHYKSW